MSPSAKSKSQLQNVILNWNMPQGLIGLFTCLIICFSFIYLFIYSVYLLYLTLLLNDEEYY
jgi:hypothetical protein